MRYFFLEGIVLPIVGFFGILANIIGISYIGNQGLHKQKFHGLMVILAASDSLLIIAFFCTFSLPLYLSSSADERYRLDVIYWTYPILHILSTTSIYITAALSLDRYLAICRPLYYCAHSWPKRYFIIPILCFSII